MYTNKTWSNWWFIQVPSQFLVVFSSEPRLVLLQLQVWESYHELNGWESTQPKCSGIDDWPIYGALLLRCTEKTKPFEVANEHDILVNNIVVKKIYGCWKSRQNGRELQAVQSPYLATGSKPRLVGKMLWDSVRRFEKTGDTSESTNIREIDVESWFRLWSINPSWYLIVKFSLWSLVYLSIWLSPTIIESNSEVW